MWIGHLTGILKVDVSSFVGGQFTFINSFDKTKCSVSDWLLFSCSGLLCLKRWVNGEIFAWNQMLDGSVWPTSIIGSDSNAMLRDAAKRSNVFVQHDVGRNVWLFSRDFWGNTRCLVTHVHFIARGGGNTKSETLSWGKRTSLVYWPPSLA